MSVGYNMKTSDGFVIKYLFNCIMVNVRVACEEVKKRGDLGWTTY